MSYALCATEYELVSRSQKENKTDSFIFVLVAADETQIFWA